jgi:hypothetical protein
MYHLMIFHEQHGMVTVDGWQDRHEAIRRGELLASRHSTVEIRQWDGTEEVVIAAWIDGQRFDLARPKRRFQ